MPTEDQCREAVQALYRVRAVEKPPGPDGRREVWHHGSKGSELLSTVDINGRLEDQEFRLFKEVLRWQRGVVMKTGKVIRDDDVSSRDNVMWDDQPSPVRLTRSKKALGSYSGNDAYLIHLRDAIDAVLAGMDWDEMRVITGPYTPGDSQEIPLPRPSGAQRLLAKLKNLFRLR